ncbi:hypothetical protein JHL18_12465 [Clostridium sp. YIM B02505]|uniref:ATP synthase I chain n=1 Tax=Clostridium yunnanense TaxID=2800325 RepID=A0ABS1EPT7_9CLOT|nr:hypothetical protein [Clostridium yunnanense]MBK1811433.1 hypothetical protein [Clostridium yunnanense]
MDRTVSKFIFGVFRANLLIGLSISLLLTKLYNMSVALAFFTGIVVSSTILIIKGYSIHTLLNFSKKKSVLLAYIGYMLQFVIIIAVAFLFISDYICLIAYILGTLAQFLGIILYCFIDRKGSD